MKGELGMSVDLGIDLGTASVLVYVKGKDPFCLNLCEAFYININMTNLPEEMNKMSYFYLPNIGFIYFPV